MSNSVPMDGRINETTTEAVSAPTNQSTTAYDSVKFAPYTPPRTEEKSFSFRWWMIVLIILAAPMILALLSVPFSIIIAIASFIFGIAAAGVSLIGAGLAALVTVPFVVFTDLPSAALAGGAGLMSIGFGILFLYATIELVKLLVKGLKFVWRKLFNRRDKHYHSFDGGTHYGQQ